MDFSSDEDDGVGSSPSPSPSSSPSSSSSKEVEEEKETTSSMDEALEMSDLMAVLPIKRGLSRIYPGKSQSFTSLASVSCIRDLSKPKRPICRKKLNPCKMITKRPFKGSRGRRQGLGLPLTLRGSESFCGQG